MDVKNEYNVSVISFKIMDSSGKQVYMLPIKDNDYSDVLCECVVYLPNSFMTIFSNVDKVFFHLSTYEKLDFEHPLLYQETGILLKDIPSSGLLRLTFKMNFPTEWSRTHTDDGKIKLSFKPYKLVGYRFSVSDKDVQHLVSDDDENEGVFFDTVIPSEVINDGK